MAGLSMAAPREKLDAEKLGAGQPDGTSFNVSCEFSV
jgi:hypothetical protein